jgi:3-methyladenine DNA glycosylase/8-oxoguanine DNA glycosylase
VNLPPRFDLAKAVSSYGYYVLAPNRWEPTGSGVPAGGRLHRPLRYGPDRVVGTVIQQRGRRLQIRCNRRIAPAHQAGIRQQVIRMVRANEDQSAWWSACPVAARAGFGRLFRSPTLFEDMVKTITACNVAWPNTIRMNERLCEHVGRDGDFPTPGELAGTSAASLARLCKVGYRAERIVRLGADVAEGRLDMAWFEQMSRSSGELFEGLLQIYGIGPYAANNILQALGRYDRVPIDSETVRHFRKHHRFRSDPSRLSAVAQRRYAKYAPNQFKAYWYELWNRTVL